METRARKPRFRPSVFMGQSRDYPDRYTQKTLDIISTSVNQIISASKKDLIDVNLWPKDARNKGEKEVGDFLFSGQVIPRRLGTAAYKDRQYQGIHTHSPKSMWALEWFWRQTPCTHGMNPHFQPHSPTSILKLHICQETTCRAPDSPRTVRNHTAACKRNSAHPAQAARQPAEPKGWPCRARQGEGETVPCWASWPGPSSPPAVQALSRWGGPPDPSSLRRRPADLQVSYLFI